MHIEEDERMPVEYSEKVLRGQRYTLDPLGVVRKQIQRRPEEMPYFWNSIATLAKSLPMMCDGIGTLEVFQECC